MSRVQFPLKLFEIEGQQDGSPLVTCDYDSFERAIAMVNGDPSNQHNLIFLGLTEKVKRRATECPSLISFKILESVRETLSPNVYFKSLIKDPSTLVPKDKSTSIIWLWGPPLQVVQDNRRMYVCLLYQVAQKTKQKLTMPEFTARCILMSICSRMIDISVASGKANFLTCAEFLVASDYTKQHNNLLLETFLHALPKKSSNLSKLMIGNISFSQINLLDEMGTQFDFSKAVQQFAGITNIKAANITLSKKGMQILNTCNVVEMLNSCVKAANQFMYVENFPEDLRTAWKDKDEAKSESEEDQSSKPESENENDSEPQPMDVDPAPETTKPGGTAVHFQHTSIKDEEVQKEDLKEEWRSQKRASVGENTRLQGKNATTPPDSKQHIMQKMLYEWIQNIQKLDTLTDVEFTRLSQKTFSNYGVFHATGNEVVGNIVDKIFNSTRTYFKSMISLYEENGYLSDKQLDLYHQNTLEKALANESNSSEIIKSSIKNACKELFKTIMQQNLEIQKFQLKHVQESMSKVERKYKEELTNFRQSKGPFPPKPFQKLTMALFTQCMTAFQKATQFKKQSLKNDDKLKSELDRLAGLLKSEGITQADLNKREYEQKQNEKIQKDKKLQKQHDNATVSEPPQRTIPPEDKRRMSSPDTKKIKPGSQERCHNAPQPDQQLIMEEERKKAEALHKKEQTIIENSIQKIQTAYKESFTSYVNSPNFKIKMIRQEHNKFVRTLKKEFDIEMRNKLQEVPGKINEIWKKEVLSKLEKYYKMYKEEYVPKKPTKPQKDTGERETTTTQSDDDETILPQKRPLVFHITRKYISMAVLYEGKPTILSNEWNKPLTENVVGQTHGGRVVYGENVAKEESSNKLQFKWLVGQIMEEGLTEFFEIFVNGKKIHVRVELFLGFILKKMKIEAEKVFFQQDVKSCVVCIPYFYTSMQRRQVMDAARVASFERIQIVNDISTAAYEYALNMKKVPSKGLFTVITESSQKIMDVGLYKCEEMCPKGKGKTKYGVRMVAHAGTYNVESESLLKKFFSIARKFLATLILDQPQDITDSPEWKTAYSIIRSATDIYHETCQKTQQSYNMGIDHLLSQVLQDTVLMCTPATAHIFSAIISKISGRTPVNLEYASAIKGACHLTNGTCKLGCHVLDLLASSLWVSCGGNGLALEKGVILQKRSEFFTHSMSNNTQVFQKLFNFTGFHVASIVTKFELNTTVLSVPRNRLRITVGVKCDGMFYLTKIDLLDTDTKKVIKNLVEGEDYEIQNCFLSKKTIKNYKDITKGFFKD